MRGEGRKLYLPSLSYVKENEHFLEACETVEYYWNYYTDYYSKYYIEYFQKKPLPNSINNDDTEAWFVGLVLSIWMSER